jgi:hypothetical protein
MSRTKASFCVITATIVTVMALFFSPVPPPALLRTTAVVRASLQQTCMLQGTVTNADTQYLVAPCAGLVKEVYTRAGEQILQQELLIRMDAEAEEQALSQLQQQRHAADDCLRYIGSGVLSTITAQVFRWDSAQEQLRALIDAKQIRAGENGVVSNLYVQPGQYVEQGALLAETGGNGLCITALWTGDQASRPKPGMEAWWCSAKGDAIGKLLLDSVAIVADTPQLTMQLCFSFADGEPMPDAGSKVPVRLILEAFTDAALIPLEAVGSDGNIWLVRDGRLCKEEVVFGKSNNESIQVPDHLAGLQVLIRPDDTGCAEGSRVKRREAM